MILPIICAISALSLYTFYLSFSLASFGAITSISDTYYELECKYGKGKGHYFVVFIFLLCVLCAIPFYVITIGTWLQWIVMPTILGLAFVGIAPQFKIQKYSVWHIAGALVCAIGALITCVYFEQWLIMCVFGILSLISNFATKKKDYTTWAENFCFTSFLSTLVSVSLYMLL